MHCQRKWGLKPRDESGLVMLAPTLRMQPRNQIQNTIFSDSFGFLLSKLHICMPLLTLLTVVIYILKFCPKNFELWRISMFS